MPGFQCPPQPNTIKNHKTCSIPKQETHNAPSHNTSSTPSHKHSMYQTDIQTKIRLHREWEEKMERLNEKYGLDCFSYSELDSESDEGEEYRYEHKYETLI